MNHHGVMSPEEHNIFNVVIGGMLDTVARSLSLNIVLELNPRTLKQFASQPAALTRQLEQLGFSLYVIDKEVKSDVQALVPEHGYVNLLCVKGRRS